MLIIGIAGGTGSGKTTVVRKIIESLPAGQTAVIPQDSYYWDSSHIPVEERQNINFDEPAAIDFNLLVKHLKELKAGHSIEQPIYSFLTCTRSNETITVEPRDIVIVEGILILCNEELRNMMDMKVFVDADADDRLIRVINRDIIERGRTVEMVIERYERVLKPMHLQHIEPTKRLFLFHIPAPFYAYRFLQYSTLRSRLQMCRRSILPNGSICHKVCRKLHIFCRFL